MRKITLENKKNFVRLTRIFAFCILFTMSQSVCGTKLFRVFGWVEIHHSVIEYDMSSGEETDHFFLVFQELLTCDQPTLTLVVESVVPKKIDSLYCLILNLNGSEFVRVEFKT